MQAGRKAIFITGAASGVGLATAMHFAKQGWYVGLADVDGPGSARALEAIGAANGAVHALDVRSPQAWAEALAAFGAQTDGRLDVLLNNAGVARFGWIESQSPQDISDQVDTNLMGVIHGARAALTLLKATPGALVVNVASVAGVVAPPQMSIYSATKFAVRGLSEALDAEYARFGVGVRCVMPWFLDTPILDKSAPGTDVRALLRAGGAPIYKVEIAAQAIWDAVHGKPRLHHLVGRRARQVAGLARWAPELLRSRFRRQASPAR